MGLHVVLARRSTGSTRPYDPFLNSVLDLAQPALLLSGDSLEGSLVGGVRAQRQPAGRGRLVTRETGFQVVQTAWVAPAL